MFLRSCRSTKVHRSCVWPFALRSFACQRNGWLTEKREGLCKKPRRQRTAYKVSLSGGLESCRIFSAPTHTLVSTSHPYWHSAGFMCSRCERARLAAKIVVQINYSYRNQWRLCSWRCKAASSITLTDYFHLSRSRGRIASAIHPTLRFVAFN